MQFHGAALAYPILVTNNPQKQQTLLIWNSPIANSSTFLQPLDHMAQTGTTLYLGKYSFPLFLEDTFRRESHRENIRVVLMVNTFDNVKYLKQAGKDSRGRTCINIIPPP